jgi:hypothetical protein
MARAIQEKEGGQVVSCIINQVCPECGGYMVGFQCRGQCRQDWRVEWERLNQAPAYSNAGRKRLTIENEASL